jgi:hypothetical protein
VLTITSKLVFDWITKLKKKRKKKHRKRHFPLLQVLAEVLGDMLASTDQNYIRLTRGLLREVVKYIRQDIDFTIFCRTLTQDRQEPRFADMEPALKVGYFVWDFLCV